jgi:hypothetical protein
MTKPRKPQYVPVPEDQKKVSGRPRKYDRVLIKDEEGNEQIVCVEVDKKRYWFVSYIFVHYERTHHGNITFETNKNSIFSLYDIQMMVGNRPITIMNFYEFKDKADYDEFNRKQPLTGNGMNVMP